MSTVNTSEILSGMNKAKVTKNGVYLNHGKFVGKVKNCVINKPFGKGDAAFIAEFEILTSNNEEHPAGSERSWYQSFQFRDTAFSEIKKFLFATLGLDPSSGQDRDKIAQVDANAEALVEKAVKENYLAGRTFSLEVITRPSKKGTIDQKTGKVKEYSNYNFSPAPKG